MIGNLAGSKKTSPYQPSDADAHYSTFHKTPERKRFSKEEWENFTRESTKKALEGLVSSPDFTQWAVANAERITLTPTDDSSGKMKGQRRRWLNWLWAFRDSLQTWKEWSAVVSEMRLSVLVLSILTDCEDGWTGYEHFMMFCKCGKSDWPMFQK